MNYWSEAVGQQQAAEILEAAATGAENELTHAWLFTGPPGSGRSNLAFRFAAALIAHDRSERARVFAQLQARTQPDATVLTTQHVIIGIDQVRELVVSAQFAPVNGRHRVIVIEDADRMPERTSNVLLKALEEPPERTVWLLCAPSEADVLPTVRSRTRSLRLRTPAIDDVARLLHERDGVAAERAQQVARLAQSHIGMARRLATHPDTLQRRQRVIELMLQAMTISSNMRTATELLHIAQADADALSEQLDVREREDALRSLGVLPGAAIPPKLRAQVRALETAQKRRATRGLRDGTDRVYTDILSLYRDVLLTTLCANCALINHEYRTQIEQLAGDWGSARTLAAVAAIERARDQLARGVAPAVTIEAMLMNFIAYYEPTQ